jgi:hypothetical protein
MNIHTTEQLFDFLSSEIIWRKKELSALRSLINLRGSSYDKQNSLIRGGITVLYAHWEGFIKAASTAYLNFIAMQRLPYKELASNFIAICMKGKLSQAQQSNKISIFREITDFFLTGLSERSKIP